MQIRYYNMFNIWPYGERKNKLNCFIDKHINTAVGAWHLGIKHSLLITYDQ